MTAPPGERARPCVLHLIDGLGIGGAERVALDLVANIDPRSFDRILCVTRAHSLTPAREQAVERFRESGGEVVGLQRQGRWDLMGWRPLIRVLRRRRPEIIHAHHIGSGTWAVLFARVVGARVIVHEHGSPALPRGQRALVRGLARLVDAIIAVSRFERDRWVAAGAPERSVHVLPNAVALEPVDEPADLHAELGLSRSARLIGCVGRLAPEKAQVVLLEALALLRESHPEATVVLIGWGPERPALEERSRELGIDDRVFLLGMREDVERLLGDLDVVVICSDREGVPLAALEYMEAGLPIVATRVGGVPEIIEDGVQGLLIPPRDPGALAGAIRRLLDDRDLAARLGERARERRRSELDPASVTREVERLYRELLAGRGS